MSSHRRSTSLRAALAAAAAFAICVAGAMSAPQGAAPAPPAGAAGGDAGSTADPGWPRTFSKNGSTVVMYQPQVDAWKDYSTIRFRSAFAVTPAGADHPDYGVAACQADTHVDDSTRTVLLTNMQVSVRFPNLPDSQAALLKSLVMDLLPTMTHMSLSLDRVLACMHDQPAPPAVNVNMEPPPIYYSATPAILVVFIGAPQFQPVPGTKLMFAVNTNWTVLLDPHRQLYYLLNGDSWMSAPDPIKGPWSAAQSLPTDELSKLPTDDTWASVRKHIPGTPMTAVPTVYATTQPAELIVTNGPPDYTPIPGTGLMYVSNPLMPLFMEMSTGNNYFLVAGRWFTSPSVSGPWSAASTSLPADFARIPEDSPVAFVLSSVPGTRDAKDAVLLASVPHKATVDVAKTTVSVTYDGAPNFAPITGTQMTYAINSPYQVVCVNGKYYCCYQAVWFMAPAATGPWAVCSVVPPVIYTIPATSPLYNVTYVRVYDSTPSTVVVGYTGGYSGQYVAATGVLMFGAGMLTGALLASNSCWYGCSPCFYSYGCHAYYNWNTGCYGCGNSYYGPHGGCGYGAWYNPSTGSWARGGYAYGPGGAYGYHAGYNANTNTWAGHASGHNGYESWGSTSVTRGDQWAQAGHTTNANGVTHGWADNSNGQWASGTHYNNSTVGKASNGDVYAGHDGNAYRRTSDGTWQQWDGSNGWQNTAKQPDNHSGSSSGNAPLSSPSSESRSSSFQNQFKNNWSGNDWQNRWQNQGNSGSWGQHDTQNGLNRDAYSRDAGNSDASGRWGSDRSGGSFGGDDSGFHGGGFSEGRFGGDSGGGFHGFGGGGGFRGRGFGGFRR